MTVASILKVKGTDVKSVGVKQTVAEAARLLRDYRIGALVVLDKSGRLAGILSERDIVRAVAMEGGDALARPVESYMTRDIVTCRLADTVADLMEVMTNSRLRHLPVVEEGRIRGLVSIGDVVKQRIAETELEARAMRDYITTG